MIESARLLGSGYEFVLPVAPTLDPIFIRELVDQARSGKGTASSRTDSHTAERIGTTESRALPDSNSLALPVSPNRTDSHHIHLVPDALPALAHSRAGIIASGTATVEAAMMDLPFVMVYRVTPLTYLLGRSTVKVPHFAMVNLIAGEQVVPELVQKDFTPEKVAAEMKNIIPDSEARKKMLAGLREVRHRLRGSEQSPVPPADRAAKAIFATWQPRNVPQAR
jgi:lipid-A-disaccharide synthase